MNVVAANKEIGNLITIEDFENLDLRRIKERVLIPGMVLAHDREIHRALRRDGVRRLVFRGPDALTVESERSIYMTLEDLLAFEVDAFTGLICQINELGGNTAEFSANGEVSDSYIFRNEDRSDYEKKSPMSDDEGLRMIAN